MPRDYSYRKTPEYRQHMRETIKKKHADDPDWHKKNSDAILLAMVKPEVLKKMRKPKTLTDEQRVALGNRGRINLQKRITTRHTLATIEKIRTKALERSNDPTFLKKLSEAAYLRNGEDNPNWKGGVSFEPYCPKFNKEFKKRVRAYFGYQCVECGTPENGSAHSVHHVSYNKKVCCDGEKPLFICLCNLCNIRANGKREYWENYFTNMINGYFQGKCYFTQEEMASLNS